MKLISFVAISALLGAAPAMAANYTIDSMHTNARFTIDHFATSSNIGGFYNLNGNVQYDAKAKTGFVDITIPVKNISTGRPAFDQHLQSADFFNAVQYPTMRFVSDAWHFDHNGKVKSVTGKLTLLGKTHPVTLKASKFNCYHSPMLKTEVCGGDFETTIDRTQWGMNKFVDVIKGSRWVKLGIQIEAAKQ